MCFSATASFAASALMEREVKPLSATTLVIEQEQ